MNDCTYNSQFFEINDAADTTNERTKTIQNAESATKRRSDTMSESNNLEEEKQEFLWSIDDDTLFHPLGLKTHGHSAGKCVFVTWSEDYLLNFVFKTSAKTKRTSLTKVRLAIEPEDKICDILILELNTLLLMSSGNVYYFSSVKSMHAISWLSDVRCISAAAAGFSVIRLLPDNTLSLELYRDVINLGKSTSTLLQRYDITFDERNLFNCQWQDERLTLHSQAVQAEHVQFMKELIGNSCELSSGQEVHFFTVSGHVFALIGANTTAIEEASDTTAPTDCHIQLICTYATNVLFVQIRCQHQLCLIFLQCGTIDIWFMSKLAQGLQRQTHHTGTQYTHYEYATVTECFYFTDERKLAQLQFHYNPILDEVHVQETFKAIPEIVACTWCVSLQLLVCLSSNNIFYRFHFQQHENPPRELHTQASAATSSQFENLQQLYELTPARITQLLQHAQIVEEMLKVPLQLHQAIEQEFVKQQLLAVTKQTRLYKNLCEAVLEFRAQLPASYAPETVLLFTHSNFELHSNSYFALLYLRFSRNDIFQASLWQLHIHYRNTAHLLHIPNDLLHTPLCIVIPLKRATHALLPQFQLKLLTFIAGGRNESDYLAISLPIAVKTSPATYTNLFSHTHTTLNMFIELSVSQLIAQFKRHSVGISSHETLTTAAQTMPIKYTLGLLKSCSFNAICKIFGARNIDKNDAATLVIHFMSCRLNIAYDVARHCITLECLDVAALYYAKLYLYLKLNDALVGKDVVELAQIGTDMQHTLMQCQCDVERCYGSLLLMDNDNVNSNALHLENLKRIYSKIRSESFYNILS